MIEQTLVWDWSEYVKVKGIDEETLVTTLSNEVKISRRIPILNCTPTPKEALTGDFHESKLLGSAIMVGVDFEKNSLVLTASLPDLLENLQLTLQCAGVVRVTSDKETYIKTSCFVVTPSLIATIRNTAELVVFSDVAEPDTKKGT